MTLEEFAAREGLTVEISRLHVIPQGQLDGTAEQRKWVTDATWYESIVTGCGPACGELTAAEVLGTVAGIARDISNAGSFEDWCEESGRDPDGRTTKDDYEECKLITLRAGLVCGSQGAFEEFMYQTEIL